MLVVEAVDAGGCCCIEVDGVTVPVVDAVGVVALGVLLGAVPGVVGVAADVLA